MVFASACQALVESAFFLEDAKKVEKYSLLDFLHMLINKILITILVTPIKVYRLTISPYLGSNCRFDPTCSQYGIDSLKTHGPFKGTALLFKRVIKCHPFNKGGIDPVIK